MLRGFRRRLWVSLAVAVGAYLIWTLAGLRLSDSGEQPAAQVQPSAPFGLPRPAPERPVAPRPRDGTFILPSAGAVTHNSVVSINGYGFTPGEAVTVEFRGKAIGKATVDKEGSFGGVNVSIGTDIAPGRYTIRAVDKTLLAETAFELVPGMPYAQPSTYSGKPGDRVSFTGGGFRSGELVAVHFDSLATPPTLEIESGATGEVAVKDLPVPYAAEGQHTFILIGGTSRSPATVPFSVLGFYPWVTLSTYNVAPQRPIGFNGQDWAPGEQVLVYVNGQPGDQAGSTLKPAAVVWADTRGRFDVETALSLPVEAIGKNTLFFRGQTSGKSAAATVTVEPFAPQLQLTTYAGQPNTEVAFIGEGYGLGEQLTAYLGGVQGGQPVATFMADDAGSFKHAGAFRIPFGTQAGQVPLTVVGETSKAPVAVTFAVLPLTPAFTLSLYAGRPGDAVSLSGSGFASGERIHVHVGDQQSGQEIASAVVDPTGAFKEAASFTIPGSARPGKLRLTVVGEQSQTPAAAEFEVLSAEAWGVLTTYAGPPGTAVQFSGRGFVGGEDVLIYVGDRQGKPIVTATADADGVFRDAGPYAIPQTARDKVTFVMVGQTSEAEAKATFTVTAEGDGESAGAAGERGTSPGEAADQTPAPEGRQSQ